MHVLDFQGNPDLENTFSLNRIIILREQYHAHVYTEICQ